MTLDRNELLREVNERIALVGFDSFDDATELREFLCECGRAGCRQVFAMTFDAFREARSTADTFIVVPGHEDVDHDEVVTRGTGYWIVTTRAASGGSEGS